MWSVSDYTQASTICGLHGPGERSRVLYSLGNYFLAKFSLKYKYLYIIYMIYNTYMLYTWYVFTRLRIARWKRLPSTDKRWTPNTLIEPLGTGWTPIQTKLCQIAYSYRTPKSSIKLTFDRWTCRKAERTSTKEFLVTTDQICKRKHFSHK